MRRDIFIPELLVVLPMPMMMMNGVMLYRARTAGGERT
jgi:hypothetical protein